MTGRRPARGSGGSDLDEDQGAAVAHDQVDLARAGAVVAGDERGAEGLEVGEREVLAAAAEGSAGVGGGLAGVGGGLAGGGGGVLAGWRVLPGAGSCGGPGSCGGAGGDDMPAP